MLICNHVSKHCNAIKSLARENIFAVLKHDATKEVLLHFAEF